VPTPGRERLSSRLTLPLQIVPIVLWLADFYVLTWVLLHRMPGAPGAPHGPAGAGPMPALERSVLLALAVPFVVLPVVAVWAAWLRRVATDGSSLFVSRSYGGQATVPLTDVLEVREWRGLDFRTVSVAFGRDTRVGRRIRFLAPTHFLVPRSEPHPVVLALRLAVEAAERRVAAPG
jgi:hypothetical protein